MFRRCILAKALSPAAIMALKEALCSVYWYKSDLRAFLNLCLSNKEILSRFNWEMRQFKNETHQPRELTKKGSLGTV
jgi:hypothetical protein